MNQEAFEALLAPVLETVAGQPLDADLAARLNAAYPAGSDLFDAIERACHEGIAAGWMCTRGDAGRRYGRVIEPSQRSGELSVDVVDLENVKGPLLIHFAEKDPRVNKTWPDYESLLKKNRVDYQAHVYPGVNHGFHNDSTGRYNREAAELAWSRTLDFFGKHLG